MPAQAPLRTVGHVQRAVRRDDAGVDQARASTRWSGSRSRSLPQSEGWPAWTDKDCAKFEKRWPLGTHQRLAYEIMRWTGLRIRDAVRLGPEHVKQLKAVNGKTVTMISLVPIKTRKQPLSRMYRADDAATAPGDRRDAGHRAADLHREPGTGPDQVMAGERPAEQLVQGRHASRPASRRRRDAAARRTACASTGWSSCCIRAGPTSRSCACRGTPRASRWRSICAAPTASGWRSNRRRRSGCRHEHV